MPQTKFVLSKALKLGLKPNVVINKIDRPDRRVSEVVDEVFELFMASEATNEQLGFPIIYASGRSGWASRHLEDEQKDLPPLFDLIVSHVPAPVSDSSLPFSMLVTTREYNSYFGRVFTGLVQSGTVKIYQNVKVLNRNNMVIENARISKILSFRELERVAVDVAYADDIIAIAGIQNATVVDTICDPEIMLALPSLPIDPPTFCCIHVVYPFTNRKLLVYDLNLRKDYFRTRS